MATDVIARIQTPCTGRGKQQRSLRTSNWFFRNLYWIAMILAGGLVIGVLRWSTDLVSLLLPPGTSAVAIEMASAAFSGLAFAGVIATLILQHRELQETQSLLVEQREEAALQNFESTFFRLLETLEGIRNDVRYRSTIRNGSHSAVTDYEGRAAFRRLSELLESDFGSSKVDNCVSYMDFYRRMLADSLGQYFRTVYVTLKYVDESSQPDKRFYTRILRAQMSNSELFMLFYNGISELGREKALPLTGR